MTTLRSFFRLPAYTAALLVALSSYSAYADATFKVNKKYTWEQKGNSTVNFKEGFFEVGVDEDSSAPSDITSGVTTNQLTVLAPGATGLAPIDLIEGGSGSYDYFEPSGTTTEGAWDALYPSGNYTMSIEIAGTATDVTVKLNDKPNITPKLTSGTWNAGGKLEILAGAEYVFNWEGGWNTTGESPRIEIEIDGPGVYETSPLLSQSSTSWTLSALSNKLVDGVTYTGRIHFMPATTEVSSTEVSGANERDYSYYTTEFQIIAIPEPGTIGLVVIGLATVSLAAVRKRFAA